MQDFLTVHKFHSLAYLTHKNGAAAFREYKIVVYHSFEELATVDPFNTKWKTLSNRAEKTRGSLYDVHPEEDTYNSRITYICFPASIASYS